MGGINELAVWHVGGADFFAGTTDQAMLQVLLQLGAGDEVRLRQRAHERDASAWRLGFILRQAIGRANWQAQAASDAAFGATQHFFWLKLKGGDLWHGCIFTKNVRDFRRSRIGCAMLFDAGLPTSGQKTTMSSPYYYRHLMI